PISITSSMTRLPSARIATACSARLGCEEGEIALNVTAKVSRFVIGGLQSLVPALCRGPLEMIGRWCPRGATGRCVFALRGNSSGGRAGCRDERSSRLFLVQHQRIAPPDPDGALGNLQQLDPPPRGLATERVGVNAPQACALSETDDAVK